MVAPAGRFDGIERPYSVEDVLKLRGSIPIEHTLARRGALKLWELLQRGRAGPRARRAVRQPGDADGPRRTEGDLSLRLAGRGRFERRRRRCIPTSRSTPPIPAPSWRKRSTGRSQRADQIEHLEGGAKRDWFAPILADAEAGFGGPLNCFEIMKAYIEAGAAGVHFEDQLASEKKCGHLGGKVLIPTQAAIRNLDAARLAADVCGVPTILVARTDAESAKLITSDVDERDRPFITGERTPEGFFRLKDGTGLDHCIARGLAFAPHADLLWFETSHPNLEEARAFAEGIHAQYPGKLLAYNCSPSFNWKAKLDEQTIASFQRELGAMGYKFQFVTLAGFHSLNHAMFELASDYRERGMAAYSELQQAEFASEAAGYTATRHQREVGTGYFDAVATAVSGGQSSTVALKESTEAAQFKRPSSRPSKEEQMGQRYWVIGGQLCRLPVQGPRARHGGDPRTLYRRDQGAHGMAAADLQGPPRRDRTLLDLRGAGATVSDVLDRPADHCRTFHVRGADEVLTEAALEFLAELHERFDGRRRELLDARRSGSSGSTQASCRTFREETRDIREAEWTVGAIPPTSGPPGRDHRPDQRQDADQRAQQRRESVHGRFRGRDLARLGRAGPGPGQPAQLLARAGSTSPIRTAASIMRSATIPRC